MKLKYIIFNIFIFFSMLCQGQVKWSLDSCIRYALENNYTVKQTLLDLESKKIQLHTTKMSVLPSVSASAGQSIDFGRGTTATGLIENNSQTTTSFGVAANLPLFQGLRIYNQTQSDKLSLQAATEDLNKTKESIETSVTAYYLQVLLCKEILQVAKNQLEISQAQVQRIEELVKNEKLSQAELYAVKSTLANDELTVTEANNNLRLALLDLAQLMNVKNISAFDVADYQIDNLTGDLPPFPMPREDVISNGLLKRPSIKAAEFRIEKGKKDIKTAQSMYYPSLYFSASYGTGYFYAFQGAFSGMNIPFGTQFKNNSQEQLSLSLNIPLFSRFATADGVKQAKLALKAQEIALEEVKNNINKDIEQAYAAAIASQDKYAAAQKAVEAAAVAFEYEEVKYNTGSSTHYEYTEAKMKYQRALSQLIQAKFDYLFRMKILEYYAR
jgi:outer membrane protein